MAKPYKIFYCGRDIRTLSLLLGDPEFSVVGVAYSPVYTKLNKTNLFNLIFVAIYNLRRNDKNYKLELFLLELLGILNNKQPLFRLLSLLVKNRLKVVDLDERDLAREYLLSQELDLIVVCKWGILKREIISIPKFGAINIHASKLPQYRGAFPILWALKNRDKKSAVSYNLLDEGMDTGDIIAQHEFAIDDSDNTITLLKKIGEILQATLIQDIKKYLSGEIRPFKQIGEISITGKENKYKLISWEAEKARDIYNKILQYPLGACYFILGNKRISIRKTIDCCIPEDSEIMKGLNPGKFKFSFPHVFIKTREGGVKLELFNHLGFIDSIRFIIQIKRK